MTGDLETVELDENAETLAEVLTLVIQSLDSSIDAGKTYEIILTFIAEMIHTPISPKKIASTARSLTTKIKGVRQ